MDGFKIFPCVPVYGDFPSYGRAITRIKKNAAADRRIAVAILVDYIFI
jgi:hypothetical protein